MLQYYTPNFTFNVAAAFAHIAGLGFDASHGSGDEAAWLRAQGASVPRMNCREVTRACEHHL